MNLFTKASQNKTKKSQKTSYSCGNKYVTEAKKTKSGGFNMSTKPVKRTTGRGR